MENARLVRRPFHEGCGRRVSKGFWQCQTRRSFSSFDTTGAMRAHPMRGETPTLHPSCTVAY